LLGYCCNGGSGSGVTLLGGAKHQCLVDTGQMVNSYQELYHDNSRAKSLYFGLSLLESCLELLSGHLKVLDVSRSAVEERDLAGLLVGDRKSILESAVTISKLIPTPLL